MIQTSKSFTDTIPRIVGADKDQQFAEETCFATFEINFGCEIYFIYFKLVRHREGAFPDFPPPVSIVDPVVVIHDSQKHMTQ